MNIIEIGYDDNQTALEMDDYGLPDESRCLKHRMAAVIVDEDGEWVGVGWNGPAEGSSPKDGVCPRMEMASGEHYELCDEACPDHVHDVIGALEDYESIKEYIGEAVNPSLYLIGHDGVCPHCVEAAEKAGIENIYVIREDK